MKYLTLFETAGLLAEILGFEDVTAGAADGSAEKALGVYQREPFMKRKCIGGESSYQTAKIRLLMRWTDNPSKAEIKAAETAELLEKLTDKLTADHIIKFADVKAVRSIGKDEKGICEYVVDADFYYTDKEE